MRLGQEQRIGDRQIIVDTYNSQGQVIHIWGDMPEPVKYVFDDYGRMIEMHTYREGTGWEGEEWPEATTGLADITRWHYHEATGLLESKVESKEYDDGKSVSYTYTIGGKLETRTWARTVEGNSLVTTYSYDPDTGELLNIDYSDDTPDITFTYDRLGRQKTITDAVGSRTFGYNDSLRLETETITGLINKTITRTYETAGVAGRSTGFDTGLDYQVIYGYEPDTGRFQSVSWNVGSVSQTATYSYVPHSDLLRQMTTNNGLQTTFTYETERNLRTQVKNEFNSQLISQYDYVYNELGLRDSIETSGSAFGPDPSFDAQFIDYTTNSLNQYTEITTDNGQPTTDTPSYDDDGNLTLITSGGSAKDFKYNAENRLISVEPQNPADGDKKVEFIYDYMGRRVQKNVFTYTSGTWSLTSESLFLYDGWNLIEEQVSGIQNPGSTYYIWGLDLSQSIQGAPTTGPSAGGIGGLIARIQDQSSSNQYYLYDANGNVTQLVDTSDGSIVAHYEYDPFGNTLIQDGPDSLDNPFRFSTKYLDTQTDLYYYGYRFYSPSLGRWISRDPIGEIGHISLRELPTLTMRFFEVYYNIDFEFPGNSYSQKKETYYNYYRYYVPWTVMYNKADPIRVEAIINYYSYNQNDSINAIDPQGLWSYKAWCRYLSGGEAAGAAVLKCQIKGPCRKGGKREVIMTSTTFFGGTIGLPGGLTYFFMTLTDNNSVPNVRNLLGLSTIVSAGYAYPGGGKSITKIRMGDGCSNDGLESVNGFLDASIDVMIGVTRFNPDVPINYWKEDCCYTGFEI